MALKMIGPLILAFIGTVYGGLTEEQIHLEWTNFMSTHGKTYNVAENETFRKTVFATNLKMITDHNERHGKGEFNYTLGMNQFGDLSHDEFLDMLIHPLNLAVTNAVTDNSSIQMIQSKLRVPENFDWRQKGAVTPVKDQGQCGSCWTFSAVGAMEGVHFIKTNRLVDLSEQNLLDCASRIYGCDGGYMATAFEYVLRNGGIDTEDSYKYVGQRGQCRFRREHVGAKISGYRHIPRGSEQALTEAIATQGPVSIAMDVSDPRFQFYRSGVYSAGSCRPDRVNHAMLAVGYGADNRGKYYLIKNSWGTRWGDKGYLQVVRDGHDRCGLATMASYPIV